MKSVEKFEIFYVKSTLVVLVKTNDLHEEAGSQPPLHCQLAKQGVKVY